MNRRDSTPSSNERTGGLWRRWGGLVIGLAVAAALVAFVWHLLSDMASTKREVAATPMLMLPPPPPPPPVPEKPPEPEPQKIKPEVVEPKPKPLDPTEPPKDDTPPSPNKDLADPVTMNSDAQAGNDAFGIQAGSGGGMTGGAGGGGLGSGSYGNYIANELQQLLARDPRTRAVAFREIRVDLWLNTEGRTDRVQMVRGTGNAQTDELILTVLRETAHITERPPASLHFPARISMRGARP